MNRLALRNEIRLMLDDTELPYQVSDDALNGRIDEAIREACVRATLITDSTTTQCCKIDIVAGTAEYSIDPVVIDIQRASLPSASLPLGKLGYKAFDEESMQWETREATPSDYLLNMDENSMRLYPVPIINETLTLTVKRVPLAGLVDDNAVPEIKETYHNDLIWWVLHLTYLGRDAQLFDQTSADRFEAKFERRFGERPTATQLESRRRAYRRRGKAQWM